MTADIRRLAVIAAAVALILGGGGVALVSALSAPGPPARPAATGTSARPPAAGALARGGWVASWAASPMAGTSAAG